MSEKIKTYEEFWPYYLKEHSNPNGRLLHYLGTTLAIFALLLAVTEQQASYILVALVAGYGPAWAAHFFIEKNKPATFTYPFWSLYSDFRMYFAWLTGKLPKELEKADV